MPIGPSIINDHSSVVAAYEAEEFKNEVKKFTKKMIKMIDDRLVSQKKNTEAKQATVDIRTLSAGSADVFNAMTDKVKKAYLDAGWSRVAIIDMSDDNYSRDSSSYIRVRLIK